MHSLALGLPMVPSISASLCALPPANTGNQPLVMTAPYVWLSFSRACIQCCVASFGKAQFLCFLWLYFQLDVFYFFIPYVCSVSAVVCSLAWGSISCFFCLSSPCMAGMLGMCLAIKTVRCLCGQVFGCASWIVAIDNVISRNDNLATTAGNKYLGRK